MSKHDVVSQEQSIEARRALLAEEKAWTRERADRLSKKRRALPWVKVEKNYVFEGADGKVTLADLFDGRSQLVVYHFMFGPEWEEGCPGCSLLSDQVDGRASISSTTTSASSRSRALRSKSSRLIASGWAGRSAGSHGRKRLQLRLSRLLPGGHARARRVLQFRATGRSAGGRAAGRQRIHQGRRRHDLPHLFHLWPRRGDVPPGL